MLRRSPLKTPVLAAVALAVCLLGARTAPAQAEAPSGAAGLTVEPLFARSEADPGDLVTQVFRIANASDEVIEASLTVRLPAGWFDLGVPADLLLPPASSQDIFVTVIVPYQAYGEYTVRVSAAAGTVTSTAEAVVFVRGVLGVDVRLGSGEQAFAGVTVTRRFTVVNTGNAPDTYVVTGSSRRGWPVSVSPERLTLQPGESGTVAFDVTIPRDARGTDVIVVRAVSQTDPHVVDEESASLRVVGTLAQPEPMVAVLRARSVVTLDPRQRTGRATLSAGGTLDPSGNDGRALSLALEMPLPRFWEPARPILSRLVYERPGMRLGIGAVSARVGVVGGLDGYGADLLVDAGPVSWGVTALREGRYALRASWSRGSARTFGMLRVDPPAHAAVASVGGALSGVLPWAEWSFRTEAAHRVGDKAAPASGVRLQGDAIIGRNRISLSAETWEPGILGTAGSSRLSAVWLNYTEWLGNLGVFAGWSVPGANFRGEPQILDERVYVGRALSPGVFLHAQQYAKWRRSGAAALDEEMNLAAGVRLNPFERLPAASIALQLSAGRQVRDAGGTTVRQTGVQAGLQVPVGTAAVGAQVAYRHMAATGGGTGQNASLTLSLRTATGRNGILDARLQYDWNLLSGEPSSTRSLRYAYQLTQNASLAARAEHSQAGNHGTWTVNVEASFDFDLPTPIPVKGAVRGRLVANDPGINVAGIILRTGDLRALTGADGTFVFPALPPGEHVIHVEGLPARVLTVPERITVDVRPGQTAQVEIVLQGAAGVEARFSLVASDTPRLFGRSPAVEGIRVTLAQDGRTVGEARTRSDGSLQFADLAPGTYELILDVASLPPGVISAEVRRSVTVGEREWRVIAWSLQELPPLISFEPLKPAAAFTYTPQAPRAGEPVVFRERATVDLQRRVASWAWEFGDGHRAEGPEVTHVFAEPGTYRVTLTVTDSAGDQDTALMILTVH